MRAEMISCFQTYLVTYQSRDLLIRKERTHLKNNEKHSFYNHVVYLETHSIKISITFADSGSD